MPNDLLGLTRLRTNRFFRIDVCGQSVQDVDIFTRYIDMVEKLVVHEIMVRLQVRWGKSQILVHVEGHDVFETNTALLVGFDQFGINAFRG